jgi:hypothetical protein
MRQYRTSGTVQGAPGNRRSYCKTPPSPFISLADTPASVLGFHRKKGGAYFLGKQTSSLFSIR